jgi:peptidoglycan hydrolase FlgJ
MSLNPPASNMSLTMDVRSLDSLKSSAARDSKGSIREAARQLESLFMQELMKSMRSTTMDSGMLDNGATEMGQSMLDTQMSSKMTGLPGGLSDAIVRQLERQLGAGSKTDASVNKALQAQGSVSDPARPTATGTTRNTGLDASGKKLSSSEQFIQKHMQAAKAAEAASGIPAAHVLGQAALETGWGKRVIRTADGQDSHNLFGIKATSNWTGKVAEVTTTEYIGGVPRKVTAKFRAYDSYEEAFKDHARLLTQSKRYQQTAVAQADTAQGYASGLQKAGYATDPAYADKLTRVINTAVRLQRTLT